MKYYVYISESKVNMLFSQIPQGIRSRIATEIKIDLKFLTTTFKDKEKDTLSKDELYAKLDVVAQYIKDSNDVGNVENPKTYVADTLIMKWGEYPNTGLVYFTGSKDTTIIGLGGSLKHVTGYEHIPELVTRTSSMPNRLLHALVSELRVPLQQEVEDFLFPDEMKVVRAVRHAQSNLEGISQKLEFLARTWAHTNTQKTSTIFGSPIYISIAN